MTKIQLPLSQAESLTTKIIEALTPGCERIEAAGSVRRGRATVGDLEIVCIPKPTLDLFGEPVGSMLDLILSDLVAAGRLLPGDKNGEKYKNFFVPAVAGLKLDLFITTPECWGVNFTIRTGSADFTKRLVTQKYKGGLLPGDMVISGARIWQAGEALHTPEEIDVFKVIGLEWVQPGER